MTTSAEWISWDQLRQSADSIQRFDADSTVIVVPQLKGIQREALERQNASNPAAVVVVCDKSPSLVSTVQTLPALLRLMVSVADRSLALAIEAKLLQKHLDLVGPSKSLFEFAVRLAEQVSLAVIERDEPASADVHFPPLTTPSGTRHSGLDGIIQRFSVSGSKSSTSLTALKAGLFLINDSFDESHSCSQSIEGMGPHRTGDYWHAILHRREPDYGNSKYWFRHVGRHPIFPDLTQIASRRIEAAEGALGSKLKNWKDRLVSDNRWDPFAFVDLCEAAARDTQLGAWCEQLQYDEMLLLLVATYEELK